MHINCFQNHRVLLIAIYSLKTALPLIIKTLSLEHPSPSTFPPQHCQLPKNTFLDLHPFPLYFPKYACIHLPHICTHRHRLRGIVAHLSGVVFWRCRWRGAEERGPDGRRVPVTVPLAQLSGSACLCFTATPSISPVDY